jgi:bla regulator protein blaR1
MTPFPMAGTFSWMLEGLHAFALTAAPAAVDALWQGIAVAAGLAVCLRFAPRISAAHRFTAWTAGFAVLAGLQLLPLLAHLSPEAAAGTASAVAGTPAHPWLELDARWSLALAGLWIVLALLRAGDLFLHSLRLRRLWKSAVPLEERLESVLATPPGRRPVQICTTQELDRPSVIGFFAPRILIPDWLYARLTPGELEQVVLHEAEHLRRHDDWTNLLQKFCLVLFPLNPALAWIERRLCREREMACDEGVVRVTRAPRAYAACLASLAERGLQHRSQALSLGAYERRPELVRRVHSILGRKSVLNPLGARALLGVVGCGLLLGSIELARCPQMIAFMPTRNLAPAAQTAQADWAQPVPAAYRPVHSAALARTTAGYHATNVEAIQSPNPRQRALVNTVRPNPAARGARATAARFSGLTSAEPRQRLLKAEAPATATMIPAEEAQTQEWVVLTSWQVQTSAPMAVGTADHVTSTKPNGSAQESGSRPSEPASSITVTRLILTVYPANPVASSARTNHAGSTSRPTSSANFVTKTFLSRPAMLPFDSGWLVIQL